MNEVLINKICETLNHISSQQGFCIPNKSDTIKLSDGFLKNNINEPGVQVEMVAPLTWEISKTSDQNHKIGTLEFNENTCKFFVSEGLRKAE